MSHLTIDHAVDVLNGLLHDDPEAIHALVDNRVRCNHALAAHPTCQVVELTPDAHEVGLVGVINAIFGVDGAGKPHIVFTRDDRDRVTRFHRADWDAGEQGGEG